MPPLLGCAPPLSKIPATALPVVNAVGETLLLGREALLAFVSLNIKSKRTDLLVAGAGNVDVGALVLRGTATRAARHHSPRRVRSRSVRAQYRSQSCKTAPCW